MKRVIYICDTPYQVFNSCNLAVNGNEKTKMDIMIDKNMPNYIKIYDSLKNCGLFNNVFSFSGKKSDNYFKKSIMTVLGFLNNKNFLKFLLSKEEYLIIKKLNYDDIFIPYFFEISLGVIKNNKNSVIHMFEDGTGSYFNNVFKPSRGKLYRLLAFICGSKLYYEPLDLYVYNLNGFSK